MEKVFKDIYSSRFSSLCTKLVSCGVRAAWRTELPQCRTTSMFSTFLLEGRLSKIQIHVTDHRETPTSNTELFRPLLRYRVTADHSFVFALLVYCSPSSVAISWHWGTLLCDLLHASYTMWCLSNRPSVPKKHPQKTVGLVEVLTIDAERRGG